MSEIKLSRGVIEQIVPKVKAYFDSELNQDIGAFDAEFLIDFFAKEIGSHFYNEGISDAKALFTQKTEELGYLFDDLEKTTL